MVQLVMHGHKHSAWNVTMTTSTAASSFLVGDWRGTPEEWAASISSDDDIMTVTSSKASTWNLLDRVTSDGNECQGAPLSRAILPTRGFISTMSWHQSSWRSPAKTSKDSKQVEQLRRDTISGLKQINKTSSQGSWNSGAFRLDCSLMWPVSIHEAMLSHTSQLEGSGKTKVRKNDPHKHRIS